MLNQVQLLGRFGKDPVIRHTQAGKAIASVSLATERKWKDNGELKTDTTWHNLVFFDPLSDVIQKFTRKGSLVYVQGRIAHREYEKDGVKQRVSEIIVSDLKLLSGKDDPAVASGGASGAQASGAANPTSVGYGPDDDIPF